MRLFVLPVLATVSCLLMAPPAGAQTWGERLGWGPDDRIVILHVDDAGMSHDSNVGAVRSVVEGVATSISVMMPCPWVPEMVALLEEHPEIDAGLHLTLTSEWDGYRWGPVAGKSAVPGLVDSQGALWGSVPEVVIHATVDEVEIEVRAQIQKARDMGFEPTHLDSHMGTLFATPELIERYIAIGADTGIPVMFPGGHNTWLARQYRDETIASLERRGEWREGMEVPEHERVVLARATAPSVWAAGLPVLDDLHNTSYGWRPADADAADDELRALKVERYSEALRGLGPGVTMVIMHSTDTSETFPTSPGRVRHVEETCWRCWRRNSRK